MFNINFHQIKSFNGSQRDAFEEMCCQLASFSIPQENSIFYSKDGSGGDAGVECYWKLPDGTEHAWQAKYFPDTFGSNQWKQIDDSIKTAIKKHPNITKYYICIPTDRTDRRVTKKDGTEENSLKKEWDKHLKKWNTWCNKANIKIDFEYWGKHELTTMLSSCDSKYAGCALYWFNSVIFTQNIFELNLEKAKNSLGDRYMPELNVELKNIEKYFDAIALSKSWFNLLDNKLDQWIKLKKDYQSKLQEVNIDNSMLEELSINLTSFVETFEEFIKDKNFSQHKNTIFSFLEQILSSTMTIMDWSHELEPEERDTEEGKKLSKISSNIYKYYDASSSLKSFFKSKEFRLSQEQNMLLLGEPGIGKSHLLASIVEERVSRELPTLFFLGQHYNGNNPWNFILDELDYRNYSIKNILGALSSAAKVKKTNALIVIDAINEGLHSDGWQNHLSNFITEINSFDNIKLIISCRITFVKRLIKIDKEKHSLIDVIHTGFKGFEHLAASIYLDKQGIGRPSAPILAPEFSNPLFLKLACEALKLNNQTSFPKGLRGVRSLFEFYSNAKNSVISERLQLDKSDNVLIEIFDSFSLRLFEEELYGLDKKNCIKLIEEIVGLYGKKGYDVLLLLLEEGVLSEDISYSSDQDCNGVKIIKFTYERFSDYKIAELIIDKYFKPNDLIKTFSNESLFGNIFKSNYIVYEKAGIIEAISVIIPEKYDLELIDIIPEKLKKNTVILDSFEYSLVWRDSKSFSERTLYYLNRLKSYSFSHFPHHDILLKLSTEPNHPWNAEMLHKNLIDKSMPERDEFWSIFTALNYFEEDEDQGESIIKTIIDWAWYAKIENTEDERVRLCSIILVWLFSTPNRKVRDYASKALVSTLSKKPQFIEELLHRFKDINDSYVLERLYCAVYGAILIIDDIKVISKISNVTYELFFKEKEPYPNILTRDYARGIIEKANSLGYLDKEVDLTLVRPPYKSKFKLEDIPKSNLDDIIKKYDDQYSAIESSIMGFPGDFGNYIMDDVHKWTSTLLSEKEPLSQDTLEEKFLTGLTIEQINLYKNYRNYIDISRKLTSKQLEKLIEEGTKYSDLIESEEDDFDIEDFELEDDSYKKEKDLEEKFTSTLTDEQSEYFRWLKGSGRGDKNIACFSRKLAQRWVCNRVYELGWRKEKFKEYDDSYAKRGRHSLYF